VATALASAKTTDRARRVTETTAAVAIWIALGFACHMTVSQYQLTGVVLVFLFQLFVRRKPLQALWLRDAPAFRLDGWGWALALVLAADPIFHVVKDLRSGDSLFRVLAHTAAVAGALPAAFVFRRFDRATARAMLLCLGFPGSLGTCMMLVSAFGAHHLASRSLAKRLLIWGDTILLYLPILFVFEEVSFRGAFDSHLQHTRRATSMAERLVDLSALGIVARSGHARNCVPAYSGAQRCHCELPDGRSVVHVVAAHRESGGARRDSCLC